jgi:hypothetical protein
MVGKVVSGVRWLNPAEVDEEGWGRSTLAIVFTDGTIVYAASDDEGNDAGALFARGADGRLLPLAATPRTSTPRTEVGRP